MKTILLLILVTAVGNVTAQSNDFEVFTLFTTQQERELINKNRYKKQKVEKTVVEAEKIEQQETEEAVIELQKIILTIQLSGVTLSQSGQHIAWLNGKAYENGSELDDGSKIYINSTVKTPVKIKTPDDKYHSIVTGETAEISYFIRIKG